MDHPPYSPDLAPSDFHLFPCLSEHLSSQRLQSMKDVKAAVTQWLCVQDPTFYETGVETTSVTQADAPIITANKGKIISTV